MLYQDRIYLKSKIHYSTLPNKHMANPSRLFSYPPIFRENQSVDHNLYTLQRSSDSDSDDSGSDSESIPTIDFKQMSSRNIGEACREWGMFRLLNHGVPKDLLDRIHTCANELFSLSFESKMELPTNPMIYFWGTPALYMSGNANNTNPCSESFKALEGFDASLSNITQFKYEDPLLETFRSLVEEYLSHQMRLTKIVFNAMAEDLNISPAKSNSYLCPSTARLRIYRYLPRLSETPRLGMMAHTDSSLVTILHQDQVGGLQVLKNGKWLNVKPIHDSLIVNIGDMMRVMSNDEYISVEHRVKLDLEKERISFGYFIFPADDAVIESSKYRPFTYAEFKAENESSLKTVGLKSGLEGFRI